MPDPYKTFDGEPGNSAVGGYNVTPDDENDLPIFPTWVYVTIGGTMAYKMRNGDILSKEVGDQSYHPLYLSRIYETGTTAEGIIA